MAPVVEEIDNAPKATKFTCIQSYLPSVFAISAIILGVAANMYCETVKFPQVEGNNDLVLFAGPWSYKTADAFLWGNDVFVVRSCESYNFLEKGLGFDYSLDAKTRTVQAFSILAPLLGGLFILLACWSPCYGSSVSRWRLMGNCFLLTSVLQGITLLVQSSSICTDNPAIQFLEMNRPELADTLPEQCEWATGFGFNIASVVLWAMAGFCTYAFPPPQVSREKPKQSQTVTYQQQADGTVQETHVTVVKGTAVGNP